MKRSGLKRRKPWRPQVRPIRRETPLAPESAKGRARRLAWKDVRSYVLERDHYTCRIGIPGQCTITATQCHHLRNRSQGGNEEDTELLVSVCATCHRFVTERPRLAAQLGWTIQNVERG